MLYSIQLIQSVASKSVPTVTVTEASIETDK